MSQYHEGTKKIQCRRSQSPILTPSLSLQRYSGLVVGGCIKMPTSEEFAVRRLTQFQRLFSDINLHVMSLRCGDFRVGTTDFVFVTWIHSRCEEATTRFEAQDG